MKKSALLMVAAICSLCGAWAAGIADWKGKKVVFLGDSITDPAQTNRNAVYWQYLQRDVGIEPYVYAVSGYQWDRIYPMSQKMQKEMGSSVDAILILLGTNDYNAGIPLGEWYDEVEEDVNRRGNTIRSIRRIRRKNMGTFRGRINTVMEYLKTSFPDQQIVLMTPLHRGYANFGGSNVQPEESFPNHLGNYVEEYVEAIREAADIWSVPLIDLYRESGLLPANASYAKFFRDGGLQGKDSLHPDSGGHRRMAKVIAAKLAALPPDFKDCK